MPRVTALLQAAGSSPAAVTRRMYIPAGSANPGTLGRTLGQIGVSIGKFCKDFNDQTNHIKEGVPIPTRINVASDRSYTFVMTTPPVSYFLKAAAGIEKGAAHQGKEVAGKVTLKHIYEIAVIKSKDEVFQRVPLEGICKSIIGSAKSMGIKVIR